MAEDRDLTSIVAVFLGNYMIIDLIEAGKIHWAVLREFCAALGISSSSLFRTAWAWVLQVYTGSESPIFGCQFPIENGNGHIWTCCMALSSSDSLLKILKTASLPDAATENQRVDTYNTAVVQKNTETASNVGNLAMFMFSVNHQTVPTRPRG